MISLDKKNGITIKKGHDLLKKRSETVRKFCHSKKHSITFLKSKGQISCYVHDVWVHACGKSNLPEIWLFHGLHVTIQISTRNASVHVIPQKVRE